MAKTPKLEKKELLKRLEALAASTRKNGPRVKATRTWLRAVEELLTRGKEGR